MKADLAIPVKNTYICRNPKGGALGFDGEVEARAAGRGAVDLVKSGKIVIANNDYEYAYAA